MSGVITYKYNQTLWVYITITILLPPGAGRDLSSAGR